MTEPTGTVQSVGVGTAIVVVANVALYLIPLPIAFVVGGGLGEAARWYTDGGYFMHLVTLLAMAQLAAGIVLGILHLHRPLPMVLYLIVPACTAIIGIAGSAVGLSMVAEAFVYAPPDMMLQMWSAGLGIAGVTRQYGLAAASLGCLSMVIGAGMAAFVRRGLGAPNRGTGAALLTAGIGVAVSVLGAAALLVTAAGDLDIGRPAVLVLMVLFGTLFAALGARGVAALASVDDAAHRALAVSLGLTCALGLVLAVVSHGAAMAGASISSGLEAMASAPPDMRVTMVAATATIYRWTLLMTVAFGLGALLIGATVLGNAVAGFGPWIAQRAKWAGAAALMVIAVIGADSLLTLAENTRQELLVERLAVKLPDDAALPVSNSQRRFDNDVPVVGLTASDVTLDGKRVGAVQSAEARAALANALSKDAPEEVNPVKKFLPSRGSHVEVPEEAPEGMLGLLAKPVRADGPCGHAAWGPLGLVTDGSTTAETAWRHTGWLRDSGACEVRLLTDHRDRAPGGMMPEARALFASASALGDLIEIAANEKNAVHMTLLAAYPAAGTARQPLELTLTLSGGEVAISGAGGTLDPIAALAGRVDQNALQKKLVEIKDTFPDESRVYVTHRGGATTVQHLLDAMDAARDVREPDSYETRALFDDPVWLGSTRRAGRFVGGTDPGLLSFIGGGGPGPQSSVLLGTGPSAPVIMGALPKEVIQRVIGGAKNKIRYCYEMGLVRHANLEGRVDIKFVISPTGNVAKAQANKSTLADAAVENCVLRAVRAMKFPKPAGGGIVEVQYPFVFRSVE